MTRARREEWGAPDAVGEAPRSPLAFRVLHALALVMGVLALAGTVALYALERRWDRRNGARATDAEAFAEGSIGTELAPLAVFEVLPELFPDAFQPVDAFLKAQGVFRETAGDWVDQYGFIRRPIGSLPVGFVLSYHRPGSGAPSPVPFVGLSCAACHSAEIRTDPEQPGRVVIGAGSQAMNLLAFSEAVRGVLVQRTRPGDRQSPYVLTMAAIEAAHAKKGRTLTWPEWIFASLWLRAAQAETADYQRVIDEPYPPERLADPRFMMAGPARTQPFRSLVRIHLDRPGWSDTGHAMDQGFSKIPAVYHQDHDFHGLWAQFDGTVKDLVARSTLAASTAGANVHNLSRPDLAAHIQNAANHTRRLAPPGWKSVFPDHPIDGERAARGQAVYARECRSCHGEPDGQGGWRWDRDDPGSRFGTVIPIDQIGTDPARISFRHKDDIPPIVTAKFRDDFRRDHPLATFTRDDLRVTDGYYAGPIGGAFLRPPYLHNASVLTLAELIGLEPRRDRFYRGRNVYDLERVGLVSPEVPEGVGIDNPVPHDRRLSFVFDTSVTGNSNRGHEYPPWGAFRAGITLSDAQTDELTDLLEYLKSL